DVTVADLSALTVTNTASEADLLANAADFGVVSAPIAVIQEPSSGILTWTPTEAQGPSTNQITVKVTDNGAPQSSDTKSFTIVVKIGSAAPRQSVPMDLIVAELTTLTVTHAQRDGDLPADTLTLRYVSG